MLVTITAEDLRNATGYNNTDSCYLATTLKRLYPNEIIEVMGSSAIIGSKEYSIPYVPGYYFQDVDRKNLGPEELLTLVTRARQGEDVSIILNLIN